MKHVRGAFVEYPRSLLRPLVNVVLFQFNPEELSRAIEIPPRPSGTNAREANQAGDVPVERITLSIELTADDAVLDPTLVQAFGIDPQLCALEKLVRPAGPASDLLEQGLDKVGNLLSKGKNKGTQLIPRQTYPNVLFIWGTHRMLPVSIDSLTINEKLYDRLLNPIRAEVSIGMTVLIPERCSNDYIAKGASLFTESVKEVLTAANFKNSFNQVKDLITF